MLNRHAKDAIQWVHNMKNSTKQMTWSCQQQQKNGNEKWGEEEGVTIIEYEI